MISVSAADPLNLLGIVVPTGRLSPSASNRVLYRDGVPIVGETGTGYELGSQDIGHKIRCHVRAVSVLDQPEAWTPESETVG